MKNHPLLVSITSGILLALLAAACSKSPRLGGSSSFGSGGKVSPGGLYREVNVKKMYIRLGTYGRKKKRRMRPR